MPAKKTSKRKSEAVVDGDKHTKKTKGDFSTSSDRCICSCLRSVEIIAFLHSYPQELWQGGRPGSRSWTGGRRTAGSWRGRPSEEKAVSRVTARENCAGCSWRHAHRVSQWKWPRKRRRCSLTFRFWLLRLQNKLPRFRILQVYTFGCNDEGALGRETTEEGSEMVPGKVLLDEKVVQVSAGDSHTAALTDDGTVFIWGAFRVSHMFNAFLT